jgi:2-methylcitrate dehydratase PrpD
MPHAIAATVQLGTAGARAFTQDKLEDADIAKLRQRVRLQPYPDIKPAPNDRPARVTMRFNDGAEMSAVVESARGGADKPFDEPTLLSKLAENAGSVFPAVPGTMTKIIRGDKELLSRGWKDTLAAMVKP